MPDDPRTMTPPNPPNPPAPDGLDLPIAVLVVRADGTILSANDLAGDLVRAPGDDLVGSALFDHVRRVDHAAVREALAGAPGGPVVEVHATLGAEPDGRPVALSVRPSSDHLVVALRDRTVERRLEATIDVMADSTLLLDASGLVTWQSNRLAERSPDGIGINPLERIHPEDLPGILDAWGDAVTNEGQRIRAHIRSRAVEDDDVWQVIEMMGSSHLNDPALGAMVVQIRNLDEGELIGSVGETAGTFQSLAEAAPIGIVVTDAYDRTVYRNEAARELLEQPEPRPVQDWRELVDEESAADLDALLHAATAGQEGTLTAAFGLPSGRRRWLRVNVTPRYVEDQQSLGLITTLEDVTPEVEARQETERLQNMLDATSDFVAIFRPGGEPLYVNQAVQNLLDTLRAEGGEGHLRELIDDAPRTAWIAAAMESLEHSDVWQGELPLNAGGGRQIVVSALGVIRRRPDRSLDWVAMLGRDISDVKAVEARLRELATHDHLTGLPNRSLFNDRLALALARHARDRNGVSVLFCDLDGFKEINDRHGHAHGDVVLVTIADRLRTIIRAADTAARVGGDEFVVVCEGMTDPDELAALAERVIDEVGRPIELADGLEVRVGISIGIGVAGADHLSTDADALLTLADTLMYRAKARGGNTFRIALPES